MLAAFLVEYPFYLAAGFEKLRNAVAGRRLPLYLVVTGVAPYLVSCWGTAAFSWRGLALLTAILLALALWFVILPKSPATDIAFLGLIAALLLGKAFDRIYIPQYKGVEVAILGHLALIRTSALALMLERRVDTAGYGFWPSRAEWLCGAVHYLYFLPIGFPLGLALGAIQFGQPPQAWRTIATFFGILWVVALSEEFFFRGVLLRWIEQWSGRGWAALLATSLLFGSVHLPFRGFPNWRFAVMAAVAGFFYGRAFRQTGSVRAAMVSHALVVVTWRGLFA